MLGKTRALKSAVYQYQSVLDPLISGCYDGLGKTREDDRKLPRVFPRLGTR